MSRRVVIVLVVAVCGIGAGATSAMAGAGTDGHGWQVHCGDDSRGLGYGWFDSKGFHVSCRTVRRVANHYTFENPGDRRFNGWHCDADQAGPAESEDSRVDCKRRRPVRKAETITEMRSAPPRNLSHEHVRFKVGV